MVPLVPVLGFLMLTVVGLVILLLPFSHRGGGFTPVIDALFAATSAATATGLATQDVPAFWTVYGQVVLLVLTFIGGLGFMVMASVLLLNAGHATSSGLKEEDTGQTTSYGKVARLGIRITLLAMGIQLAGFVALLVSFSFIHPPGEGIWKAFSLTILAFNNAGLIGVPGLEGGGASRPDWGVLAIAGVLIVLGAISCIVILDAGRKRRWVTLSLNTKIVFGMTGLIALAGTGTLLLFEFENPATLGGLSLADKMSVSAFEVIAGRTSGFATISYAHTEQHTSLLMMGLMLVGGASASAAGGIKVNTVTVLIVAVLSAVREKKSPSVFRRGISFTQVKHAMTLCISMIVITITAVMLLTFIERGQEFAFVDMMFEVVSAISTAGLSTGLASDLSTGGKLVLIVAMFIGRVFPLSVALLMIGSIRRPVHAYATERVTIG